MSTALSNAEPRRGTVGERVNRRSRYSIQWGCGMWCTNAFHMFPAWPLRLCLRDGVEVPLPPREDRPCALVVDEPDSGVSVPPTWIATEPSSAPEITSSAASSA